MIEQIVIPSDLKPRRILPQLISQLDIPEILVLSGARQVGKTYLLFLLIRHLLEEKKIPLRQIFFYNLEIQQLLDRINKIPVAEFISELERQGATMKNRIYVFIDEIQYLSHPSSFLKQIIDQYPQIKLIVSGSSSFEMKKKFTDRLTGRKRFIEILPLSLEEMAVFKNLSGNHWQKKLFSEYILYGGYPRVVLRDNIIEKKNTLLEIYNDYVRKDIRDLASIPEIGSFNNLVGIIASQIGNLVSETRISTEVGLARPTVKKYLHLLQGTFVLSLLPPYSRNPRREFVRRPKVYFKDTGLRNAISGGFNESFRPDWGALVENVVYEELLKNKLPFDEIYFWRTKQNQEVDFILRKDDGEIFPLEVKWQKISKPAISSSFASFLKSYQPQKALVITSGYKNPGIKKDKTVVYFLPAWEVAEFSP